jgi:hypothetical protein
VLRACVDASWSDQPPRVTVVAGYVAPLDESARVEDEWIAGLRDWRIPYFRLSQLRALVGRDADLCERFFSNIITSSKLAGVGAAVLNADWDEPDWGDDATIRLPTRYEQCLDSMLALIGKYAMKNFPSRDVSSTTRILQPLQLNLIEMSHSCSARIWGPDGSGGVGEL